jgi:hypothetical protein
MEMTIEAVAISPPPPTQKKTKKTQETFLRSILQNESKCWTEFYKNVKRPKSNRENIPAIKDGNGRRITDSIEKAKFLLFFGIQL